MLEFQLTPDSISTVPFWLTALLALSSVLSLISLIQLSQTRLRQSSGFDRLCRGLLAVLATLQAFTWQLYFYRESHDTVPLWGFVSALIVGIVIWRLGARERSSSTQSMHRLTYVFVAISVIQLAGFAQATKQFSQLTPGINAPEPGCVLDKASVAGVTDGGTKIRLAMRSLTNEEYETFLARTQKSMAELSAKAMLREPPYLHSNCHGWVFTGGEHLVRGEDVQLILNDNGYAQVQKPEPSDIAIYRDDSGAITHTGLVRGNLGESTMVESKWGIGAIYLHVADEQPYGKNIEYYRTTRGSHLIETVAINRKNSEHGAKLVARQAPQNSKNGLTH